jgi:murein L,D-transpeptidase YcbB/YkuD
MRKRLLILAMVCGSVLLADQNNAVENLSEQVSALIRERIPGTPGAQVVCRQEKLCGSEVLPRFYMLRAFRPAWTTDDGPIPQAGDLVDAIRGADREGLNPEDYHLDLIETLLAKTAHDKAMNRPHQPGEMTDLDLLLTDAFLLYASHLSTGRVNPETIEAEWFIKSREVDLVETLYKALENNQVRTALEALRPPHAGYAGLKEALAQYKHMMKKSGWPKLTPGPKMEDGGRSKRVAALRSRLVASGDLEAADGTDPDFFDDLLEQAVKRMQKRHGLDVDGIVGPATLAALNIPVEDRVHQIEVNLERWRWLPHTFGPRYIQVNIANFELEVMENSRPVLTIAAIVGRSYRRTPVFTANMTYLEFNPYWNVPKSIAQKDIIPRARKDPEYLVNQHIRVFENWTPEAREIDPRSVDWSQVQKQGGSFVFRQDPGPDNALGRVKFMFPNKFSVYVHDTPHHELFEKTRRSFSSGCVRVAEPVELATYLLKRVPEWTEEKILATIDGRERTIVSLPEPIPVQILYFTAWVDEDGEVNFRNDIYERDEPLYRALTQRPPKP